MKVDLKSERKNAQIYEEHFRWFRRNRVGEFCKPWRLAHEMGWIISSPIDINFSSLQDFEVSCSSEEVSVICDITGSSELWKRDKTFLAMHKTTWLRLYDFRTSNGWEAMFIPMEFALTNQLRFVVTNHLPELSSYILIVFKLRISLNLNDYDTMIGFLLNYIKGMKPNTIFASWLDGLGFTLFN